MHLTETPTPRGEPRDVADQLREIDPTLTLVHLGAGQWLLGSVQPNEHRGHTADRLVASQFARPEAERRPGVVVWGRILRQGLRAIEVYDETELNSGKLILDFREREWWWRNRPDEAFTRTMKRVSDGRDLEQRIVTVLDAVHGEWKDVHRYAFRHRRSVINPGLN